MNAKNIFSKLFSKNNDEEDPPLPKILKSLKITVSEYDQKMIENIIHLSKISVREIIVPRVDVVSIDTNSEIKDIIKIVAEKGHSRLPVFDNNIDNIIGILHSKDLLSFISKDKNFELKKIIRPPLFIPESKMINDLLVEFREKRVHLAIVVDEYGGMSGIVCLEDIIEKIVGDIQDEFDNEVDDIIKVNNGEYLINPRITLEELNERLGTNIYEDEVDTLGGMLFMKLGKIPVKNEAVEYDNFLFTIEAIAGRKIKKIKMQELNSEIMNA